MRLAALLLAILLLPAASAGWLRGEVEDARGDGRDPTTDILEGWLDAEPEGLRFHIRMAAPDARDHVYWLLFTIEATGEEVAAAVGYGSDGALRGHLTSGPDAGGLDGRTSTYARGNFDRIANDGVEDPSVDGAVYSGLVPWGAFDGFEPGVTLDPWGFGNTVFVQGRWTGLADGAEGDGAYVARVGDAIFPILVPAWVIPTIVVVCALAGMGGGLWLARATRARSAAPPAAPRVDAARDPAPPGARFRHAPPPGAKER